MKPAPLLLAAMLTLGAAPVPGPLELPAPHKAGGMPLMDALTKRSTARAFDTKALSKQQLSDVLWAAFGINRPDGKRTAPSSRNRQEVDIYVLLPQGVFVYGPKDDRLGPVSAEDLRAVGSAQDFVRDAPVTLVYVADLSKMTDGSAADKEVTAAFDTGFISQNVYLACASQGLATGVRSWLDREVLAKRMGLRTDQRITAAQSIGFPKP